MSKHTAATEGEIAELHKLITQCHKLKLDAILKTVTKYQELDANEVIAEMINTRDISAIQKWVEYNGVSAVAASQNGETELGKKLRMIKEAQKGKVVSFHDTGTED